MSKSKTSDKNGSKDAVTAYAVGDPGVVNCLLYDTNRNSHSTSKYTYDISIMDGKNGRGSDMVLAVYDVGDYRTVDYLRQDVMPFLGQPDNLATLELRAESRIYCDPLVVPPSTLRSLIQQYRCPDIEIFHCGGSTAATAIFGLYDRVNSEPFEKKVDQDGKSKKK